MDSDDDEFNRAIQLSLQSIEPTRAKRPADVVDLTEDDPVWPGFEDQDDMDFWKAIVVSMGEGTSICIVC
jgi:hypothetical protein